jgi:hypothetical protein
MGHSRPRSVLSRAQYSSGFLISLEAAHGRFVERAASQKPERRDHLLANLTALAAALDNLQIGAPDTSPESAQPVEDGYNGLVSLVMLKRSIELNH